MNGDTLLMEIGNTHLKWAWLPDADESLHAEQHGYRTEDWLPTFVERLQRRQPEDLWIASVAAPAVSDALAAALSGRGVRVHLVTTPARSRRWVNAYAEPARLGVDRWLAMLALREQIDAGFCLADCGTAVTFDQVDAAGRHRGGLIMPGIALQAESLVRGTALPAVQGHVTDTALGRDTESGIRLGVHLAVAGAVEKAYRACAANTAELPELVLCGGGADAVSALLEPAHRIERDLVLRGLGHYLREIQG